MYEYHHHFPVKVSQIFQLENHPWYDDNNDNDAYGRKFKHRRRVGGNGSIFDNLLTEMTKIGRPIGYTPYAQHCKGIFILFIVFCIYYIRAIFVLLRATHALIHTRILSRAFAFGCIFHLPTRNSNYGYVVT